MCNASISLMQLTRMLVRFACLVVCLLCLLDCECVLITLLILCCIHVVTLSAVCFMIFDCDQLLLPFIKLNSPSLNNTAV